MRPDPFAAAIPVAGGGDPEQAKLYRHVPIWAFHGEGDLIVNAAEPLRMVEALQAGHGKIHHSELEGIGHKEISRKVYTDVSVHRWLFQQRRSTP